MKGGFTVKLIDLVTTHGKQEILIILTIAKGLSLLIDVKQRGMP